MCFRVSCVCRRHDVRTRLFPHINMSHLALRQGRFVIVCVSMRGPPEIAAATSPASSCVEAENASGIKGGAHSMWPSRSHFSLPLLFFWCVLCILCVYMFCA